MPFVEGNSKIHKSVLCFSIPPVKTCPNCSLCKSTCYALQAYQQYPNVRRAWNHNYKMTRDEPELFRNVVKKTLDNVEQDMTRIHVAGDFFSQAYLDLWTSIACLTNKRFYVYTKAMDHWNFQALEKLENINIINSIAPDGLPNYGPPTRVFFLRQEFDYYVCPATRPHSAVKCGLDCTYCHIKGNNKVAFIQH